MELGWLFFEKIEKYYWYFLKAYFGQNKKFSSQYYILVRILGPKFCRKPSRESEGWKWREVESEGKLKVRRSSMSARSFRVRGNWRWGEWKNEGSDGSEGISKRGDFKVRGILKLSSKYGKARFQVTWGECQSEGSFKVRGNSKWGECKNEEK